MNNLSRFLRSPGSHFLLSVHDLSSLASIRPHCGKYDGGVSLQEWFKDGDSQVLLFLSECVLTMYFIVTRHVRVTTGYTDSH